jgi:hypothetical protein
MKKLTGLSDKAMREEIGAVCIYWSLLELIVERVIADLEHHTGTVVYKPYFKGRLERLEKLAKRKLPSATANEISKIKGAIEDLIADRDRVVHGLWVMDDAKGILSVHFGARLPEPREKRALTQDIRQIKKRIFQTYQQLEPFAGRTKSVAVAPRRKL